MNPNQGQKPVQLAAPSPEQVTGTQIENTLAIMRNLHPFLFPHVDHSEVVPRTQSLDGEAQIAASNTFIKACSRLDALLEDTDRWGMGPYKEIYAAMNGCYAQQFQFLKAQTYAANQVCRPSFLLKPDLARLEDQSFIAYWGDITTPGAGLIGRGATPEAAFADFDAAYSRQDQIKLEIPPESDQPTPDTKSPRKKK